ncbi:hypothetical protein ACH3VR_04065 [Microbacterium sp. B2969]|uniref:Uncharacterized protein n=1 Tax=Microbacterium alkaliflavum TaxID=3248839 RepID=A0ABW7Q4F7_9MICO
MAAPSVVFAHFGASTDRALLAWRRASRAVFEAHAGAAPDESAGEQAGRVYWQLVAPNHREMARSTLLHASESDARAHAATLVRRASGLTCHTFVAPAVRSIGWYLVDDDAPVVMGARWYESRTVAREAAFRARSMLETIGREGGMPPAAAVEPEWAVTPAEPALPAPAGDATT